MRTLTEEANIGKMVKFDKKLYRHPQR